MDKNTRINSISISVTVNVSQEQAFELFVKDFSSWYPSAYTWSRQKLDTIEIEPYKDGRCFERGAHHFETDWGRVLTYQPPTHIVFSWQISANRQPVPDPEKASEVEVRFISSADGKSTTVQLEHRKFKNHKEDAREYREALASPEGWPFILGQFKTFVNHKDTDNYKSPVRPVPAKYHTVTPYLIVEEVEKLIAFMERAFGGEKIHCTKRPDGSIMHAEVRIGDSVIMMGGANKQYGSMPFMLHLYVEDVDAVYKQAVEAGGQSLRAPADQFYGDRSAGLKDAWDNQWWIATHIEDVPEEEMKKREKEFREQL